MAQSPEYPDLQWIEPRAWGKGRDGKAVRYIVIHYTAGSETATSAENGAIYNQNRRDGTSAHYFVDRDSVVQGVRTRDRANCARHKGNRLGIQYELCGTVQTRAQWLDAASLPTLRNAARQAARDCRKYGIPVRRLSVAETRRAWTEFPNGPKGFVGHVDCTYAYPEDGGDHTDPGTGFPWDIFLDMVRAELEEDDDMASPEEFVKALAAYVEVDPETGKKDYRIFGALRMLNMRRDEQTRAIVAAIAAAGKGDDAALAKIQQQLAADAAADAARDAALPALVRDALGVGQSPEQVAALLAQIPDVDWPAVGRALTAHP